MFWLMIAIMMLNFVTPFAQMAYEQIHLTYVHSHMVYAAPPHPKQPIEVTIPTEHELAPLTDYLFRRAEEAGVTPNLVRKVIYCESQWTNTQSRIVTADGSREHSRRGRSWECAIV